MHIWVTSCLGTQPPFCPSSPLHFIVFSIFSFCLVLMFVLFNWVTPFWPLQKMQGSSPCAVGHSTCQWQLHSREAHNMCDHISFGSGRIFRMGWGVGNVMRCKCFPVACSKAMREPNGPGSSLLGEGPLWTQGDRSKVSWKKRAKHNAAPLATAWKQLSVKRQENEGERGRWIPAISPPSPKSLLRGTWQFWAPRRDAFSSLCPDVSCFTKSNLDSQVFCSE